MRENIMRILYALFGALIGLQACFIRGKAGVGICIIFAILGLSFALAIKEEHLDTMLKQIIGLAVGVVFFYPIAYILQYLVAVAIFVKGIVKWFLQFEIFQAVAIIVVLIIVGIAGYLVYDQAKYSKK